MTSKDEDSFNHGLDMLDAVYGPGVRELLAPGAGKPLVEHTVRNLFGEVWDRPHLSIRDRRLLVFGVTAMLNRPDLVEIQALGALRNGELDEAAIEEIVLMISYYAGWPTGTGVHVGMQAALKAFRAEGGKP